MVRYLLGQLPEDEQNRLEDRFFTDDDYFEELRVVEDELIDAYAQGKLSRRDRELFETRFLASPAQRRRVELAKTLMRSVSLASATEQPESFVRPQTASWRYSLTAFLRGLSPAGRFALATVALLIALGGAWLMVETLRLRNQLERISAEQIAMRQREQAAQQQLAEQRARNDQLAEQLEREQNQRALLEQALVEQRHSLPTIISFALTAGLLRDPGSSNRLVIPPGTDLLRLRLDLEDGRERAHYRAVIRTVEGNRVWSQQGLRLRSTNSGKAIVLRLPATLFAPGDYILTLSGVKAAGEAEDINDYYFRIVRR